MSRCIPGEIEEKLEGMEVGDGRRRREAIGEGKGRRGCRGGLTAMGIEIGLAIDSIGGEHRGRKTVAMDDAGRHLCNA
jgi:hypothetical protein